MEHQYTPEARPANPRRRQRSQAQIFKETYLPVIIAGIALLLIVIFIIGSITRSVQRKHYEKEVSLAIAASIAEKEEQLRQEASSLLIEAGRYAEQFDYIAALQTLESYSGDLTQHSELSTKYAEYSLAQDSLVLWNDPNQVLNLSFQLLIADPERAFKNASYGTSYNKNFITTEEFSAILLQLYEKGYILIRTSDMIDGTTIKDLYLPNGKKPLIITQTNVNYNTYMIDGDGDKLPDKNGAGFASKLIIDDNNNLTCEMVDADGETVTGAYDLVPILNSFIETHPDFSYKGARAILAVTGYDGLFGYRTNSSNQTMFDPNTEIANAKKVIQALRDEGYELACYTYSNISYGNSSMEQIKTDLDRWNAEVVPVLGSVDMLVYARNNDISATSAAYSGEKFSLLQSYGFTQFFGFCTDGKTWYTAANDHVRQGRLLVSGANLAYHADWFAGILEPSAILDSSRGNIPE